MSFAMNHNPMSYESQYSAKHTCSEEHCDLGRCNAYDVNPKI